MPTNDDSARRAFVRDEEREAAIRRDHKPKHRRERDDTCDGCYLIDSLNAARDEAERLRAQIVLRAENARLTILAYDAACDWKAANDALRTRVEALEAQLTDALDGIRSLAFRLYNEDDAAVYCAGCGSAAAYGEDEIEHILRKGQPCWVQAALAAPGAQTAVTQSDEQFQQFFGCASAQTTSIGPRLTDLCRCSHTLGQHERDGMCCVCACADYAAPGAQGENDGK